MLQKLNALVAAIAVLAIPAVVAAQGASEGAPKLLVPEKILDLGTVPQGDVVDAVFKLVNEGAGTLQVKAVRPTCGCTVADFDREIKAGATGTIKAKLDTTGFNGAISKSLLVLTNDADTPSMSLVIRAMVQPYLEILPRPLVRFNAVQHEDANQKVTVISAVDEDFEISGVKSSVPYITADVRKLGKDEIIEGRNTPQYEITLGLADEAPVGPITAQVEVFTNHPKAKKATLKVFGVVRALLHVTPSQLQFGTVEAAMKPGRNLILVNNREDNPVEVTDVSVDDEAFEPKVYTIEEGKRYQVTVSVKPEARAGSHDATLTIRTTDGQFSEISVPVRANLK
jgi:hypothetical protein